MSNLYDDHPVGAQICRMLDDGITREDIHTRLSTEGHDMKFIVEIVSETIKMRHSRRVSRGLTFVLAGAILCLTSFLLAITGIAGNDTVEFVLYGLTGGGVIIAFYGLTFIF